MATPSSQPHESLGVRVSEYANFLAALGLSKSAKDSNIWELVHRGTAAITVTVDPVEIEKSQIEYHGVECEHRGILNFKKEEHLVVLACMADLIRKGYRPEHLTLEKTWPLGRRGSGRLDILIHKPTDTGELRAWAMVECKTWKEYVKEQNRMRKNGGQLFTYWFQERDTEYLYLYTTRFSKGIVERKADYIPTQSLNQQATTVPALHASWDKVFALDGLFHKDAVTYDSVERLRTKADLSVLDHETGTGVFNAFAEVLRRHSVSDKGNAFNKIFNLFVCKIVDEDDHGEEDVLDFQITGEDSPEVLFDRLDRLYRRGLERYLGIAVAKEYVTPVQNFSFIDVYDKTSFMANYRIVKEVVRLLQPFKLKYSSKQQHLGDFFELLLNTGVKQEAGQFFTPVPLAQFAVRALPLDRILRESLLAGGNRLFPRVIDYACGSGHFITEAIEEIQTLLDAIDASTIKNGRDRKELERARPDYAWTRDFVYGIEKDHRLAKVTKIATFLNGDGDATILHADGLASFDDPSYRKLLRAAPNQTDNPVFDVLVANPPYSVPNFREGVSASNDEFTLLAHISPTGSEIECLFIERAAQLLRPGGVAAIILPAGVLTNEGSLWDATRLLLLRKFRLRAAVLLGKNTFMATGISTVMLFLEKREDAEWNAALADEPTPEEALSVLLKREKTLVAETGTNQQEKDFLGYAFTTRRGSEGIQLYEQSSLDPYLSSVIRATYANGTAAEKVLDELNSSLKTASPDLRHVIEPVCERTTLVPTSELFKWEGARNQIDLKIATNGSERKVVFPEGTPTQTLGTLIADGVLTLNTGKRPKGGVARIRTGRLSLGGEHIDEGTGALILAAPKRVPNDYFAKYEQAHVRKGDILICKDGAKSGKVAFVDALPEEAMVNEHLFRVSVTDAGTETLLPEYLFAFLFSAEGQAELKNAVGGSAQGGISQGRIKKVRIPTPSIEQQKRVTGELKTRERTHGLPFFRET